MSTVQFFSFYTINTLFFRNQGNAWTIKETLGQSRKRLQLSLDPGNAWTIKETLAQAMER
jgi:hypothetical protein